MSQCVYCRQRKGKRSCPALERPDLQPMLRRASADENLLPPDCAYLETGSDYQQKRLGEQFAPVRRELYRQLSVAGGEKAAAFFNLIEVVTFGYFQTGATARMPKSLRPSKPSAEP